MNKILFLVQLPPPIHGASAVNQSIKQSELLNKKYSTCFLNISPAKDLSDIGKSSISKLLKIIFIFFRTTTTFLRFKPNLTYITLSPHGLAFYKDGLIALALKAMGGKLVFHLHGKGVAKEANKSWLRKKIYRLVFKNVNVIHLSETLFSDLDGIRDSKMSITAVPNGINDPGALSLESEAPIVTFVYLSNLIRAKGADILIRATAMISDEYNSRYLVKIIGKQSSAEYAEELKKLITTDLAQRVKIIGPKYGAEKFHELSTSNVFVLPTKNDCFPLAILEAMATGLAVISTNEGAIAEIVDHGVTGDILRETTAEVLAEAMTKHIVNQSYSSSCAKQGREKFLRSYTTHHFELKLCTALNALLTTPNK